MKYRALSATGDYLFGHTPQSFLVDSPQAVGQAVLTRLLLQQGELFYDTSAGVPYASSVVGYGDKRDADAVVIASILGTAGVVEITNFDSLIDPTTRRYGFSATIQTQYGVTTVTN